MIQTQRNEKFVVLAKPGDKESLFEANSYGEVLKWCLEKEAARTKPVPALPSPSDELSISEEALQIAEAGDQKTRKAKRGRIGES